MAVEYLSANYYLENNGQLDSFVNSLGNCFNICSYFVLKKGISNYEEYCDIFLTDTTICLSQFENKEIENIWLIKNNVIDEVINLTKSPQVHNDAFTELERLLDSGEIVVAQTVNQMLPFSRHYNSSFDVSTFVPNHAFIIIHHDKDYFYVVDSPNLLNSNNYECLPSNKEVVLFDKHLAQRVFNEYCCLYTVSINEKELHRGKENFKNCITDSVNNYQRESGHFQDKNTYFGREAILRLADICESEIIRLDSMAPHNRNYYDYLDWKIWAIKGGRKVLYECIRKKRVNTDLTEIENSILNTINLWEKTFRVMGRKYARQDYLLNSEFSKYFNDILKSEDEMIHLLRQLI